MTLEVTLSGPDGRSYVVSVESLLPAPLPEQVADAAREVVQNRYNDGRLMALRVDSIIRKDA